MRLGIRGRARAAGPPAAVPDGPADQDQDQERQSAGPLLLVSALVAVGLLATAALVGPPATADGEFARSLSLPAVPGYSPAELRLVPGAPAPAGGSVLTAAGQRIALSSYAGQPVIINFFAAWSPPCQLETRLLASFYRLYNRYDGKVIIIGVDSRDRRGAVRHLLLTSGVTYPVAWDPAPGAAAQYGVPGLPTTYFLDARHQIVRTNLGWLNWHKLRAGVAAMDAG